MSATTPSDLDGSGHPRAPRRRWARRAAAAALLAASGGLAAGHRSIASGASYGAAEVGAPPAPATAVAFVGHFDQVGAGIHGYGFVSHVDGLADGSLFSTGASLFTAATGATVKQALLTFDFRTSLTNRAINGSIIDVGQAGTIGFYLNRRPVADFAKPTSFATGATIASARLTIQDVLVVIAPNRGIATATGSVVEQSARSFTLGGGSHQFGRQGLAFRVFMTGQGMRTAVFPPAAQFDFAGDLTVGGR